LIIYFFDFSVAGVQFLAFRLQEVAAERDALSIDLRKTKVQALPICCSRFFADYSGASRRLRQQ